MRKIVCYVSVFIFLMSFGGCALPKKNQVYSPPSGISAKRPPLDSVYGRDILEEDISPTVSEAIEPEQPAVQEEDMQETLPSMVFINDRIFAYGQKLERWKELDGKSAKKQVSDNEADEMISCFRKLQAVLNGYSSLRSKMLQAQKLAAAERIGNMTILELEKNDIAFLESSCGQRLGETVDPQVGWTQPVDATDLPQLENLIDRYAENREYQEIVGAWQKIPAGQIGRVHLRTKIHYGNALIYLQKEEAAADIYKQVVDQMSTADEQATDLVSLRKKLADLHTATGNYQSAAVQYKKISEDYQNIGRLEEWSKLQLSILDRSKENGPELKEYSALLRDFLGYVPDKDGYKLLWQADSFLAKYPYSPVASNVDAIKAKVQTTADKWFDGFLAEVDKLRAEKKFQEAQDLLKTLRPDIIGPEKQLVLKGKNDELSLTDAVDRETQKMVRLQDLQNQWNNGMILAKSEKFDEAITVFSKLLGTDFSAKASDKIKEMTQEAAKAERKKAASMFTRYTKTTDVESKKKLLLETHKLLKGILVKYPEVDIRAKVVGNIERVEQEMMAIDPKLLVLADPDEAGSFSDTDGAARTFAAPSTLPKNEQYEEIDEALPVE